ncbi:ParB/RepB/Spo0J family partition protein [Nocardioides salarius]|uniref:ParB/RepB/Spo0J family partition protein n=1 Tax=Nocardioides salarius TaxID=374513 RepID=UPI0030F8A9B5
MNAPRPATRRGLGRGLGSLIPTSPAAAPEVGRAGGPGATEDTSPSRHGVGIDGADRSAADGAPAGGGGGTGDPGLAPVHGAWFSEIPVAQIVPNRVQPRQVFDEDAMAELVHSIREVGLLQPIVVRRVADESFELVMGERRWRASQEAGLTAIPAIVRETDDTDMLRDALLENLHRSELNPLEEASAYAQLLEDFGCTHDELAQRIGRSRPQISNTLRLLRLSPAVQRRVAAGVLSAGHARSLLAVDDADLQDRLAQRVVSEGISVRGLEEIVAVGDHDRPGPRTRRSKPSAPGLADIAERLSDRLETRVKVDMGRSKGKISVEFATMDDLQRIIDVIDPRNRRDRPI